MLFAAAAARELSAFSEAIDNDNDSVQHVEKEDD